MENETLQVIFKRKSVRSFRNSRIDEDTIDLIMRAGMEAPSAMDCRPWRFVVINDQLPSLSPEYSGEPGTIERDSFRYTGRKNRAEKQVPEENSFPK